MSPLLELHGARRVYGTGPGTTAALAGIDLSVDRGEFVAIVGPSGAGKSTLLNVLGLLDAPTSGSYLIDGTDAGSLRDRQRDSLRSRTFGFVFQSSHVLPDDSVARNAAVGLRILGVGRSAQESAVGNALGRLGLSHRANASGRSLSGGERQRLALARAVATAPDVILADEPTGNLDSGNSDEVIRLLSALHRDGATVIVITHDPRVAAAAERQVTIDDGVVAADTGSVTRSAAATAATETIRGSAGRAALGIVGDAVSALTLRPARVLFLLLAFLVGTGSLVAAVGLSETTANQVSQRLARSALDELSIVLPAEPDPALRSAAQAQAIERVRTIDHIIDVGRRDSIAAADGNLTTLRPGAAQLHDESTTTMLGGDDHYLALSGVVTEPTSAAEWFAPDRTGRYALVGDQAAEALGLSRIGPGSQIWIGGRAVDVIGMIAETGRLPELRHSVFVSHAVSDVIAGVDRSLVARTDLGFPSALAEVIPTAIDPGAPGSVTVNTAVDLRHLRQGVADDLTSFVAGIAWVLLGLSCVSASAIMFLAVQARTAEIGLRRALGSGRAATTAMFVLEGLLIGTAGGLAGIATGLAVITIVSAHQGWVPVISPDTLATGLVAGATTGVLAALAPALRAASIDPAEAVRA
ncbi:ATP-binding cassette domain-containing protein [Microbacteriaceae bacterium VKM Ac-2855]|nr:ATP-binding cassette domain-containing protein [Microbacteriaceae bacterium VKM Ac-2855]